MHKSNLYESSFNLVSNSLTNFVTTILILLITFNLGWLMMFVRVSTRLAVVVNLHKTIFNLQSLLLLGNLSLFLIFMSYVVGIRSMRSILGRRY